MAKAIAPTPTLKGKDTKSFLKEMKDQIIKMKIKSNKESETVDMLISFKLFLDIDDFYFQFSR